MKKSFAARRVPRRIVQDEDNDTSKESPGTPGAAAEEPSEPVVKRPSLALKPKKTSKLRLSFGASESSAEAGSEGDDGSVFALKKSNLSRLAIERNAERTALRTSLSSERLPFRAGVEDRPSYTKEALAELQSSTPTTPRDLQPLDTDDLANEAKTLDIASKFGNTVARRTPDVSSSAIPTDAEIREKKARRARLAKEQAANPLLDSDEEPNDDDDDISDDEFRQNRNEISLRPDDKYPETRLIRDDEDIAEGFEDYVDDGKINLGRKAEHEAERKRRAEMADLIADAEGDPSGDEEMDDSEAERNAAYEAAQTKAGAYAGQRERIEEARRPKTPPKITPVPELSVVLERLKGALRSAQEAQATRARRVGELEREKAEIAEREAWIQGQLKEAGERYEKLRIEAGLGGGTGTPVDGMGGGPLVLQRGLESLGNTPLPVGGGMSDGSDA
ncbi:hypothetical protein W97_01283 [Coniosporium apollinis CBS 100218]|uniref:Uncharacterized protein n=1 Tax=Coniosporium apollinis (strain CBS 100218) TaxID=1168221 RepID=R7YJS1_CONA1|nr:uncharacterized protein W97_01283 [Coniosporium apollinis CBS 100218]EON62064.1 hypothetical protein W97_01283 [Coniosporium apollinis CBS 100218]